MNFIAHPVQFYLIELFLEQFAPWPFGQKVNKFLNKGLDFFYSRLTKLYI